MTDLPTPDDLRAARELLEGVTVVTPMEESRWLSSIAGGPVKLKCENLQRTGSFKSRGAYVRIARLSPEERAAGVVAASAGNHAQGVALAAQMLGIRATVFMPEGAPIPKEKATKAYGADVVFHGRYLENALARAREFAAETGATLIHPFDHVDIVAGQASCGLEILDQAPDVQTVMVPTGGGGLLAGIALAVKATHPHVRVVGVQAEGAAAFPTSLERGEPTPLASMQTMADGIAVGLPGKVTFHAVQKYVDDIVTVSEESLSQALLALLERAKMVVEPAGAAAVAALLDEPDAYRTPAVAVLSGGNIDPLLLIKVIEHGLSAAGRYVVLRVVMEDAPGSLARLTGAIAEQGLNILSVEHRREGLALPLDAVEVVLTMETRDPEHRAEIVGWLRDRGYDVELLR